MTELHYLELTELGARIESREVSSVEATRAQLERIAALDSALGAYCVAMADSALVQSAAADAEIAAGTYRGPLHVVSVAVKDLCWTKGVPTAGGMAIHMDFRPGEDAAVVRRFAHAGAVLLGKPQLTEGAYADQASTEWHRRHPTI